MGKDYKFSFNLIDPLADASKKDGITVKDDLNKFFREFSREGVGAGAYWQGWDTRGEKGRDEIQKRLKNSKIVGTPFNNTTIKDGIKHYLPTLWILDTCPTAAQFMKQWRWDEWADTRSQVTKDAKNSPQQKWSHFNMVWECIFKHSGFRVRGNANVAPEAPRYYQGKR